MVSPSHLAMRQEAERERERGFNNSFCQILFPNPPFPFQVPEIVLALQFPSKRKLETLLLCISGFIFAKVDSFHLGKTFLSPPRRVLQLRNMSPYLWRLPWLFIPFPFLLHGEGSGGAPETSGYSGVKGKQERERLAINSIALEEGAGTGARQFLLVYVSWPLLRAGAPFSPLSRLSCFPFLFVLFPPQIAVIGKRGEKRDGTWLRA